MRNTIETCKQNKIGLNLIRVKVLCRNNDDLIIMNTGMYWYKNY